MLQRLLVTLILAGAVSVSAQDYAILHDMLIKFYCYQRGGLSSGSSGNCNGQNVYTGDNYQGNKLDGGWFDAGDYIKFGMPLSYAVYCLLKGYDIFPVAYTVTGGIPNILTEVKFATDYMMKAVINENTIILDVGCAEDEHQEWGVSTKPRKYYTCSGADIPAAYAACLALMSTLYRKHDAKYADSCLQKAIVAFKFAKKKIDAGGDGNLYCSAQKKANEYLYYYYTPTDGTKIQRQIGDKMAAAGVELYRATNDADPVYKVWAKKTISNVSNCMSYSFIGPLAAYEVWNQGLDNGAPSIAENVGFIETKVKTEGVFKGVYQNSGWGTARDVGTASFVYALAFCVTGTESQRTTYQKRAADHIAWVTGTNSLNRSFIVGFGNSPPTDIHYRPTYAGPKGGVVSGPDGEGKFENNHTKPEYVEVALDYNAGIVGGVAFLKALKNPGSAIQVTTAFTATPDGEVDFTGKSVSFSAGFSKSVAWTLKIAGAFGSRTYTGTGTDVSQTWDGSADSGLFLSGESVAARLTVDGTIVAYDIIKARAFSLYIAKANKPAPSSSDVLIDDFEDGDSMNKVNGMWIPVGNQTAFASKTALYFSSQDNSKALHIVGNVSTGERSTFAGVKTTFNAAGTPGPIGPSKTVVFNMKASIDAMVSVELEQAGITDSAYYRTVIPITKVMNTYRLPIANFRQPDWKTVDKPLDLNSISALRFAVYDSTGRIELYMDNVYIDSFSPTKVINPQRPVPATFKPVVSQQTLRYTMPLFPVPVIDCAIYTIAGRAVMKRTIGAKAGETVALPLDPLPAGMYTVVHSVKGKPVGSRILFCVTN